MFNRVFAFALLGLAAACSTPQPATAQAADSLVEGTDYALLQPAQPTASGDKVEVLEVFGYWCIHCARFDPILSKWKAEQPADVAVSYVPAIFSGGVDEVFARAFYTAETMGVLDQTHGPLFTKAAVEHSIKSPEDILAYYADQGIDKANFEATMNSFAVNAKVARTKQTLPRYGIEGTPSIIVAGKYRVLTPREGGFERMLQVTEQLIARERASKKS